MITYFICALFVLIIVFLISKFQKPGILGTFTGILSLLSGMCGVFLITYGTIIVLMTIEATSAGKDATGLGIIVGPLIGLPGLILLILFLPAIRLLKLKKIILIFLIASSALAAIFFQTQVELKKAKFHRLNENFDIYNPTTEMIRSMNNRIKNEFQKHKTLFLTVRYYPPKTDQFTEQGSLQNYYIETIGRNNIKRFKWGPVNDWFSIEINEAGYNNLRKSKFLRSIYFNDLSIYGKPPKFIGNK